MVNIRGCITALVTPFNSLGKVDEKNLKKLIKRQIDNGVHGLVPCGTTGESPTLSHKEHIKVIEITVKEVKRRIPVIAGTGSNSTQEAIELTKKAESLGADASLQVVPYYNKPTQRGLYNHFNSIASNTKLPIILYNIPGRSVISLDSKTIQELEKKNKNIIGIKEASGDLKKIIEIKKKCTEKFLILSGEDNLNLDILKNGGSGFISVTSNLYPHYCSQMYNFYMSNNIKKSNQINSYLKKINKLLFVETNPIPIKYALAKNNLIKNELRLPLTQLDSKYYKKINEELKRLKKIQKI
tara:strand:- start:1278 stop:2171 length:894 start_codon:yes stop_codon:yes gene_type:complete